MGHLHHILCKQKFFRKNKNVSLREILNSIAEEVKESVFLWLQIYASKNQNERSLNKS